MGTRHAGNKRSRTKSISTAVDSSTKTRNRTAARKVVKLDAAGVYYKDLNREIRSLAHEGIRKFEIHNVYGQRYLGTNLWGIDDREKISERYPQVVIAIVDSESGTPSIRSLTRIAGSLAEYGIGAGILVDRGLEVTGLYNITNLPTSMLIDPSGKITYRQANFLKSDIDQVSASLDRAVSVSLMKGMILP